MSQDLFETPELLPFEVLDIMMQFDENGSRYEECESTVKKLNAVGYTCEYGLDGILYNLTEISI